MSHIQTNLSVLPRRSRRFEGWRVWILLALLTACTQPAPPPLAPPTEQLSPAQLLDRAAQQQQVGQYDQAAGDYQQVIQNFPESDEAREARFGLAYSAFLREDWAAARSQLDAFVGAGGGDAWFARAVFLLARVAEIQGDHAAAIAAYERYAGLGAPLLGYAHIRRAAQLEALGDAGAAAAAYEAGGAQSIAPPQRVQAYEAAIRLHDAAGSSDAVLRDLQAMLSFANLPSFRPPLLERAADQALAIGESEQAVLWLRELVDQWGGAGEALTAIDTLNSLGIGTAAYREATIAFTQGDWERASNAYAAALEAGALDADQVGEARRRLALAQRELGDFSGAQATLEQLAAEQPDTRLGRQARIDAIQTYGQAGDRDGSIELYRQFVEAYPDDPLAPEAMRRIAEIVSWSGDSASTNNAWFDLGRRYPWSSEGQEGLHTAAMSAYLDGNFQRAFDIWKLLGDHNLGMPQARGYYWAGRMAINLGDQEQGVALLQKAYAAAPNSYYAARVADLLGHTEAGELPLGAPIEAEAAQAARAWISTWAPTATISLEGEALQQRATELKFVALPVEAQAEWIAARDAANGNPQILFEIALAAFRGNTPYVAVTTARALMELAPVEAGEPPVAIRQLLYPTPFAPEIVADAQAFDIDPRVVYALMRQESIFNPEATSWVGARGLAQVMPETGAGIAQNLAVADFHPDDLYEPQVSIRFGTFYIAAQVERMNGSIQGGLAAYNGGPGNAERWANGNVILDPDLFLLTIDFPETAHYVEVVYANYGAYRRLYHL